MHGRYSNRQWAMSEGYGAMCSVQSSNTCKMRCDMCRVHSGHCVVHTLHIAVSAQHTARQTLYALYCTVCTVYIVHFVPLHIQGIVWGLWGQMAFGAAF